MSWTNCKPNVLHSVDDNCDMSFNWNSAYAMKTLLVSTLAMKTRLVSALAMKTTPIYKKTTPAAVNTLMSNFKNTTINSTKLKHWQAIPSAIA